MNRLVHILMIIVIVSCPLRCAVQGCGCFALANSCCSTSDTCCSESAQTTRCDCESRNANPEHEPTLPLPQKCTGECFCSGVTVADNFSMSTDQSSQPLFQPLDSLALEFSFRHSLSFAASFHPPDDLLDDLSTNRGRQVRCLIGSFVI